MKCANNKYIISLIFITLFTLIGCSDSGKQAKETSAESGKQVKVPLPEWPPKSPTAMPSMRKVTSKAGGIINLGGHAATRLIEGEVELPYNLFAAESPDSKFFPSRYEVVYFNDKTTRLKLDPSVNAIILSEKNTRKPYALTIGTIVHCGDKFYVVKEDGWYESGKLVHKFSKSAGYKH